MQDLYQFIEQFLKLTPEGKELLSTAIKRVKIRKGTIIILHDDACRYAYIIKKGIVKGYCMNENGEEVIVSIIMEFELFGYITSSISTNLSVKSYEAIEDTEAYKIRIELFRSFFEINHEICNLGRIIAEKYLVKSEHLKTSLKNRSAEEKYKIYVRNYPGMFNRVKLKHIASFMDMTPETLSRIRKNLIFDNSSTCSNSQ